MTNFILKLSKYDEYFVTIKNHGYGFDLSLETSKDPSKAKVFESENKNVFKEVDKVLTINGIKFEKIKHITEEETMSCKAVVSNENFIRIFQNETVTNLGRDIKEFTADISSVYKNENFIKIKNYNNEEFFVRSSEKIKHELYEVITTLVEEEIMRLP